ncbi:MAG: hypothetical protein ABW106_01825 [Steroidobacteraceae bacterium]
MNSFRAYRIHQENAKASGRLTGRPLPGAFDAYLKGGIIGRTVVRIAARRMTTTS